MPRRVGRYALGRRIGGGGMGDVFLALNEGAGGFQREVVIKQIRAGRVSAAAVEQFRREGLALAALSHRNVVQVIELDRDGDDLYLAMEYLRGVDLGELVRGGRALAWPAAVYVAGELARGLAAAHAIGLVHGDVSPSNVMACVDGAVKVLDFGLASDAGDAGPAAGVVRGKPSYLAPEVLLGAAADPRADVYAVGAVLYQLLVGEVPIRGATPAETVRLVQHQAITPPSARIAGLPAGLDAIVLGALARDRGARTASADALADQLDAILEGRFGAAALARLVEEHQAPALPTDDATATTRMPLPAAAGDEPRTLSASTPGLPAAPPPRRRRGRALAAVAIAGVLVGAGAWLAFGPRETGRTDPAVATARVDASTPPARAHAPMAAPTEPRLALPEPALPAPTTPEPATPAPTTRTKPSRPPRTRSRAPATPTPRAAPRPAPTDQGLAPGTLADPFRGPR